MGQTSSGILTSPSRVPVSHKAEGLSDEDAHKLLTLECIFKALDTENVGWVDRQIVTDWIRTEPYLQDASVKNEADRMLALLSHDEGGDQCSYREFVLAFLSFTAYDVQLLCVNLLRSANTNEDRMSFLDPSTATECDRADDASYSDIRDESDSRSMFLLDTIFTAMDTDEDDCVSKLDYLHWLSEDSWFDAPNQSPLTSCITQLSASSESIVTRIALLQAFLPLSRRYIKQLLIHLLHRSTHRVIRQARLDRKKSAVLHRRGSSGSQLSRRLSEAQINALQASSEASVEGQLLQDEALETEAAEQEDALAIDTMLIHQKLLSRRHSIMITGDARQSSSSGLRLCLLGQCMLQHSLFDTERGRSVLAEMRAAVRGDVVFSELETAIYPSIRQSVQNTFRPADSVFFHAAPAYVIDCVRSFGVNLFGMSNNHVGDLGESGIYALMDAMRERSLTFAGVGKNEEEAAAPAFHLTDHGRIALVSFACKVPPGSDATVDRPGVNAVWMEDLDSQKLRKQDVRKVIESIVTAKSQSKFVITYNHNHYRKKSNINEISKMATWARRLAHKCIDAGSHLYVCHGDPRLGGIEIYRHGIIFYGLGSFIFQTRTPVSFYGSEVWEGCIVQLHCRGTAPVEPASPTFTTPPSSPRSNTQNGGDTYDLSSVASYSIKLIPIAMNEIGDGFDPAHHENAVKGNIVADKQSRSNVASPAPRTPRTLRRLDPLSLKPVPSSPLTLKPVPTSPLTLPMSAHNTGLNDLNHVLPPQDPSFISFASQGRTSSFKTIPSSMALSESYDLHLATRGLPKLASRTQAIAILKRIQDLSKAWGTVIQIDDPFPDVHDESVGVVGWVSCKRAVEREDGPPINNVFDHAVTDEESYVCDMTAR